MSRWLLVSGGLIILSLLLDFAQLTLRATYLNRVYNSESEKYGDDQNAEADIPSYVGTVTSRIYFAKALALAAGFGALAGYFVGVWGLVVVLVLAWSGLWWATRLFLWWKVPSDR